MELITLFFIALLELSNAMSLYILLGLLFAGILHELVSESLVTKHLGRENISSVIKATVFGIPLPVCSCGVIPLASSIKKSGASKGSTLSFLISTPITGVDSILATFGMFGWIFTIYRVVTSMIIAMVAGILTNIFDKDIVQKDIKLTEEETHCCCSSESCSTDNKKTKFSLTKALHYAFVDLLEDIAKPLFWGLILGALITIAIPQNLSTILTDNAWISYFIAIIIAVPMYVCATASLPIAAALMLSGVSAGAAFVFLSAGPATNTVTIGVVKKMLGTKSLYIYLSSIILGSIIFGLGLDYIFDINSIDVKSLIHTHEESGILEILSSIVLWGLMLFFITKSYLKK
ncbi:MAG: permease [Sulfurimonas sp. RIFOXYD12_FULL_33_39]|uniref:SO_0444 family Cu/Zn efflux transporter n=1 Tax=unclassified Sulfurimonas TaxID=2623549 RepID=UPI0008C8B4A4|nr:MULTISPECIES: SO_0444 family Cu/Zn efflux transporter [unclassified Sulfurimonas]OHE07693.1 MAG: permease [Sulfurimonas sp. RIFCSPLOWO2_12_FULL_34_6]OHE10743.1 MAG: permease [Sulfurimonas sp. RIFOXYD12_FULL_33_39]OHE13487.1 MAG: permease [Sulfurimonas sp. RIFOXYD2_FULL_34_21]